jgi:hypothetical protein
VKIPYNLGAILALLIMAVALVLYWRGGLYRLYNGDLGICILALVCAPTLALMLYMLRLRERIDALEKRHTREK